MIRKILLSAGMLVFVGAAALGATGAFFNDVETSTGNTFAAGEIDLKVDSEQHYNNMVCVPNTSTEQNLTDYYWQPEVGFQVPVGHYPAQGSSCNGTWALSDLVQGVQKFFNFDDIKPGDEGENTISLHITSNPAWACINVSLTKNDDNDVTEPESSALGELDLITETVPDSDLFDGELAQNLKFAAWLDQGVTLGWQGKGQDIGEGDNIWQGAPAEPLLFSNQSGPASDVLGGKSYSLADSTTGFGPMTPNQTNYIGLQWCAGTQTVGVNTITCDGSTLGNIVQTDSLEANITFRVEQSRNNPNFRCTPLVLQDQSPT
jgi:predicted ribosomally synthesized peptide with SipW-like signal peptide